MTRTTHALVVILLVLTAGLAGCQKPNFDEMMKPPPRPVELDQLNSFVGTWEGTWEMKISGEDKPRTGKGTDVYAWDAGKWVMLSRGEGTLGEHKMTGTGLWTWDSRAKVFRYTAADNYGMVMTGTCRYDEKNKTWHMRGHSMSTIRGDKSSGEGTLKMPDPNTMEWSWTEWDGLHLIKFMEMKGTSHRK